jgi:hypothetical protein
VRAPRMWMVSMIAAAASVNLQFYGTLFGGVTPDRTGKDLPGRGMSRWPRSGADQGKLTG